MGTDTYCSPLCPGFRRIYNVIGSLTVDDGRFLSYSGYEDRHKVAVVGTYLANDVFGGDNTVGQTVKIGGNQYTIVGVLAEQADSTEGSADDCIYIPYTTASKLTIGAISNFTFATTNTDYNDQASDLIDRALYEVFQNEDFYTITDMASLLDQVNEMTGMMTMVLVGIASISLLVGGVGIMNIMLVSVTERTREIGIRKSLGAKRKDIMRQFVIEAGTTSALGGVVGIAFGIGVAILLGNLIGISARPTFGAIALSFGVSLLIGVFFGFAPANKAAKLNPIDALRYE